MGLFDNFFNNKKNVTDNQNKSDVEILMIDWFSEAKLSYDEYNTSFYPQVFEIFKNTSYIADIISESEDEKHNLELNIAFIYLIYHFPDKDLIKRLKAIFYNNTNQNTPNSYFTTSFSKQQCASYPEYEFFQKTVNLIFHTYLHISGNRNPYDDSHKYKSLKFSFPEGFIRVMDFAKDIKTENKLYVFLGFYCYKQNDYSTSQYMSATDKVQNHLKDIVLKEINTLNKSTYIQLDLELFQEFFDLYYYKKGFKKWTNTKPNQRQGLGILDFPDFVNFIATNDTNLLVKYLLLSLNLKSFYTDDFLIKTVIYLENQLKPDEDIFLDFLTIYPVYNEVIIDNLYIPLAKKIGIQYHSEIRKKLENIILNQSTKAKHLTFFNALTNTIQDKIEKEIAQAKYTGSVAIIDTAHGWTAFLEGDKNKSIKSNFKEVTKIIDLSLVKIKSGYYDDAYQTVIEINLNGETQKIKHEHINAILFNENIGYQLIPVPFKIMEVINDKYYKGTKYFCGLQFLNQEQYNYLISTYLIGDFLDINIEKNYSNYNFANNNPLTFKAFTLEKTKNVSTNAFLADNNWKWFKEKYVDQLPSAKQWYDLMEIIISFSGSKKPTKKWNTEIATAIKKHGESLFYKELRTLIDSSIKEDFWYFDSNRNALKAIAWTCSLSNDAVSLIILKQIISNSYTKVPNVGPRSGAIGNSALEALIVHPNPDSFGILNLLRNQTKYARFANVLDKYIDKYIDHSDEDEQQLADKAIPDFDFNNGEKIVQYSGFAVKYVIKNKKLSKKWIVDAKETTTTPAFIKEENAKILKEVSSEFKSINTFFKLTKSRVKTYWLNNRQWDYKQWNTNLNHNEMLSPWLNGLLWKNKTQESTFMLLDNKVINSAKKEIKIADSDIIALWHPVMSTSNEIIDWQKFVLKNKIDQSESQVFREFYPFSDSELKLDDTSRFNHHFLTVKKLMAIANSAGWIFTYVHEDVNWPRVYIKALDITAHLKCEYNRNDFAIPTKGFYFTKNDTRKISYNDKVEKIMFDKIPETTRSEICRDIDLFIATTSVAHNIELSEQTELLKQYREDFSFGKFSDNAQAKIRKQIITLIGEQIGLKKINFEKNYLLIDGELNKYTINLGSGFAQLKETKRHIPIIPNTNVIKKKINKYGAITGDDTLYIILAKALFLQNDADITDQKILQIIKNK